MYVVAPLVVFLLLCVALLLYEPQTSWRRVFLSASVLWGVILTGITELLSAFRVLTSGWVFVYWALVALALLVGVALTTRWRKGALAALSWRLAELRENAENALRLKQGPSPLTPSRASGATSPPNPLPYEGKGNPTPGLAPLTLMIPTFGLVAILAGAGLTGLIGAPNSVDTLSVSLARAMFWIQHGSVAPYPTANLAQLTAAPWASFCAAHLYLLSGSDMLTAAISWWSMLGSVLGVSLIARQLGAPRVGQIGAALFLATAPMSVLQATSGSVYVAVFWLVCLVHFALAFRMRPQSFWNICGMGASLGLALLTSAASAVIAAPLALLVGYWAVRRWRWGVWEPALIAGATAFVLNSGYLSRNLSVFGSLLGPPAALNDALNMRFDPLSLMAHLGGAIALQFATPPASASAGWSLWSLDARALNPDYAGNPLHALLLVGVALAFVGVARLRRERVALAYGAALALSFLAFALVLRWSPASASQELVYVTLGAPLVGLAFARLAPAREAVARLALTAGGLALILASLPWLLANTNHPLIGSASIFTTPRATQYFAELPNPTAREAAYRGAAAYLQQRQCATIGLVDGPAESADASAYLWWELMPSTLPTGAPLYIEYVNVANASAALAQQRPYAVFAPCAIIQTAPNLSTTITYQGAVYRLAWRSAPIGVYIPQ